MRLALIWIIGVFQSTRYVVLSALSLTIYEWLHCLDQEIILVLRSSWTSVKVAYLVCRYYPLLYWPILSWAYVGNHPLHVCLRIARPIHALGMPIAVSAQAVFMMRAYSFSGRNLGVLLALSTCFATLVGTNVWLFWVNIPTPPPYLDAAIAAVTKDDFGCFLDYRARALGVRILLAMVIVLTVDIICLGVVIIYCFRRPSRRTPLGKYFLRQGLAAFAFTASISAVCLVNYFRSRGAYSAVTLPLLLLIPDLVACRLILQLRRRVKPSDSQILRRNSRIIREALDSHSDGESHQRASDVWAMDHDRHG